MFGAYFGRWIVVKTRVANGSKENGIGIQTNLMGFIGIGVSHGINGSSTGQRRSALVGVGLDLDDLDDHLLAVREGVAGSVADPLAEHG